MIIDAAAIDGGVARDRAAAHRQQALVVDAAADAAESPVTVHLLIVSVARSPFETPPPVSAESPEDGAVGQRAVVVHAAAEVYQDGVARDRASAHRQRAFVVDAAAARDTGVAGDRASAQRQRAGVVMPPPDVALPLAKVKPVSPTVAPESTTRTLPFCRALTVKARPRVRRSSGRP